MDWLDEINSNVPEYDEVYSEIENDETEWRKDRLGMVTGSQVGKLVVKSKDKQSYTLSNSKTTKNLIYKIAWERLLKSGNISNGLGRLNISSKEMEHGNDYEGEAIKKYIEVTGREVISEQRFVKDSDWLGGTPDGFVGTDGLIEVKCPFNGGNHLKSMLEGVIYNEDYLYQMQSYLLITNRKWCDFVTYDPDLIESLQLNIIRVERDEEIIEGIKLVVQMVSEKIQEIINNQKLK